VNQNILQFIICPECRTPFLSLEAYSFGDANQVIDGRLICSACNGWFRIENGIIDLLPFELREKNFEKFMSKTLRFAEKYNLPLPESARDQTASTRNKAKPIGTFEDTEDYERRVVNLPYYQALDELKFVRWIERNLQPGQVVLDIGCGSGMQSIPLAENRIRTIGIDIDEDMLLIAAKKMTAKSLSHLVDLVIADGQNMPVREKYFDAAIYYGVLHHLSEKSAAIANAAHKLVPGGHFYTLDPHKSRLRFVFDFLMKLWKLYVEEASDAPLISEEQMTIWTKNAGLTGRVYFSTYLPPHFFFLGDLVNVWLLNMSDNLFNTIPGMKSVAGVIMFEGTKQ
jgi:SAM-dependent methyltransferase/uncharacterized protein YbaR (Trm112 family)